MTDYLKDLSKVFWRNQKPEAPKKDTVKESPDNPSEAPADETSKSSADQPAESE